MKLGKVVHAWKHWASHRKEDLASYSWCRRRFVPTGRLRSTNTDLSGVTCLACLRRIRASARKDAARIERDLRNARARVRIADQRLIGEQLRRNQN